MIKEIPDNLGLAKRVNSSLVGTLNFQKFAKDATDIILEELNLAAVAIFRIDHVSEELKSYAYAVSLPLKIIDNILGIPFTQVKAPLNRRDTNFVEDTANTGKLHISDSLEDFSRHVVGEKIGKALQRVLKTKTHLSLPVLVKGKIEGVLFCATPNPTFSENDVSLLRTITNQLGLAMANIMAHERIIKQYKTSLAKKNKVKKDKPNIKFTLRIDDEIQQYLFFKTHNTKTSKADFVRTLLRKDMEKRYEDK